MAGKRRRVCAGANSGGRLWAVWHGRLTGKYGNVAHRGARRETGQSTLQAVGHPGGCSAARGVGPGVVRCRRQRCWPDRTLEVGPREGGQPGVGLGASGMEGGYRPAGKKLDAEPVGAVAGQAGGQQRRQQAVPRPRVVAVGRLDALPAVGRYSRQATAAQPRPVLVGRQGELASGWQQLVRPYSARETRVPGLVPGGISESGSERRPHSRPGEVRLGGPRWPAGQVPGGRRCCQEQKCSQ